MEFKEGDLVYYKGLQCVFKVIRHHPESGDSLYLYVQSIVRSAPWCNSYWQIDKWDEQVYLDIHDNQNNIRISIATEEQIADTMAKRLKYGV